MMALLKTFNRMRPGVAAFALGTAQAMLDYLYSLPLRLQGFISQFNELNMRIQLTRQLLHHAAAKVDTDPFESASVSLAKIQASQLAEQCAIFIHQVMDVGGLIEHPLLMKWQRDVYGYEYMEGTSIIQRKNIINLCEQGQL